MNPVVFIVDTLSHAYSSVGVARRLQHLGYSVEYWGSATNVSKRMIEQQGFAYHDVDELWPRYQDEIRLPTNRSVLRLCARPDVLVRTLMARRRWMRKVPDAVTRCQSALDRLVTARSPLFVVIDPFLLAYYPFLWARRVTTIVLCTKPLAIRDPLVPPYDSSLMPPRTAAQRAIVRVSWIHRRFQEWLHRVTVGLAHRLGAYTYEALLIEVAARTQFSLRQERVRRWIQPDLRFKSLYEWVLWIPEMDLPRRWPIPADAHVNYVGPSVCRHRQEHVPHDIDAVRSTYLIYVAVGTARFRWRDNVPFLRKVIRAFADLPAVSVVISTSDARATRALGLPPKNVRVYDFAPQLAMLERADLVITHAGAGTLRECIEQEVPLLAYPRNHDQMGNSARIVFHQIGLRGHRRFDTPGQIQRKAMRILHDDRFRQHLRRLRTRVHESQNRLLADALARVLGLESESVRSPLSRLVR